MGSAVTLTAIVLGLAAPTRAATPQASDSSALAAVASSCAGATIAAGDEHSRLEAMYCGINVVRRTYGLWVREGKRPAQPLLGPESERSAECGFTHTPCGMSFRQHVQEGGLSAGALLRREPCVGARRARLAAAHAPALAQLTASSTEPDGAALARPRDRIRAWPHVRSRRRRPLGDAVRSTALARRLSFRLRGGNS